MHVFRFWICLNVLLVAYISTSYAFDTADTGVVELRVTDHQAGIEDFRELGVRLRYVAIHPESEPRHEGWIELSQEFVLIDIVPLKDGRYVSTGVFTLPTGKYNALKVEFSSLEGVLHNNMLPDLSGEDTTVAASLEVFADTPLVLTVDLYVESQTDHKPNLYVVKVREIRVGSQ